MEVTAQATTSAWLRLEVHSDSRGGKREAQTHRSRPRRTCAHQHEGHATGVCLSFLALFLSFFFFLPLESGLGSETAPAQFREPQRPRRRPEPARGRAQQVSGARPGPLPEASPRAGARRLTISERPSRQAFWKRVWRSSWGRSLKPVYLICKAETARNQESNPRRRPPARSPRPR